MLPLSLLSTAHNMHPKMPYTLSNPAPGHEGEKRAFVSAEFFEVDSPVMKMRYSEVVWRTLPGVALPEAITKRYANATMAVTGFEVDLLRKNPTSGAVESVAAYESYNHHYGVSLVSSAARVKLDADGRATGPDSGHGKILELEVLSTGAPAEARLQQSFTHGNGQEHRQIFHGAPRGYAQPIFAPSTFVVTPMQISTNDGSGRKGGAANPWILPSAKQLGLPDHPPYAPILECPCTTRINRTTLRVDGDCRPEPLSDLLVTKNPTCQAATYVGGLNCCGDGLYLLDADQTPPSFVDEVFFRFRFYYEDHDPAKHEQIDHVEWAGNGCDSGCNGDCPNKCHHIEWDVIQGVGSSEGADVARFQSTFAAGDMLAASCAPTAGQCMDGRRVGAAGFKLLMAAAHCHAPNCLRQELINVESGEMLCRAVPQHGASDEIFDELGYLSTPPCLWGPTEDGLLPPPVLRKETKLQMVTYFNSTFGHPGQMGIWQMKAAPVRA